jgi:hypothetical protein
MWKELCERRKLTSNPPPKPGSKVGDQDPLYLDPCIHTIAWYHVCSGVEWRCEPGYLIRISIGYVWKKLSGKSKLTSNPPPNKSNQQSITQGQAQPHWLLLCTNLAIQWIKADRCSLLPHPSEEHRTQKGVLLWTWCQWPGFPGSSLQGKAWYSAPSLAFQNSSLISSSNW